MGVKLSTKKDCGEPRTVSERSIFEFDVPSPNNSLGRIKPNVDGAVSAPHCWNPANSWFDRISVPNKCMNAPSVRCFEGGSRRGRRADHVAVAGHAPLIVLRRSKAKHGMLGFLMQRKCHCKILKANLWRKRANCRGRRCRLIESTPGALLRNSKTRSRSRILILIMIALAVAMQ